MNAPSETTASLRTIWPAAPRDRDVVVSSAPAAPVAAHRRVAAARWYRIPSYVAIAWIVGAQFDVVPSPVALVRNIGIPTPDIGGGTFAVLIALAFLAPIVVATTIIGIVIWRIVRARSRRADWSPWAAERGLTPLTPQKLPQDVPLFAACNDEPALRWSGRVGAHAADIGVCWYLISGGSDDPDEFNAFVYIAIELPPAVARRFDGVLAQQHRADRRTLPGRWKPARFESSELDARYHVATAPEQDQLALYELFDPAFIDRVTHGPAVNWHQVGSSLVAWRTVGGSYFRGFRGTTVHPTLHPPLIDSLAQSAAALADHYASCAEPAAPSAPPRSGSQQAPSTSRR